MPPADPQDLPDRLNSREAGLLGRGLEAISGQLNVLDAKVDSIHVSVGRIEGSLRVCQGRQTEHDTEIGGLRGDVAVLREGRRMRLRAIGIAAAGLFAILAAIAGAAAAGLLR